MAPRLRPARPQVRRDSQRQDAALDFGDRAGWAVEPGPEGNGVVRWDAGRDGGRGDSPQVAGILSQRLAFHVRLERTRSGPLRTPISRLSVTARRFCRNGSFSTRARSICWRAARSSICTPWRRAGFRSAASAPIFGSTPAMTPMDSSKIAGWRYPGNRRRGQNRRHVARHPLLDNH